MALVKKGPFFIAIKFKLSLVFTFMAFYHCVRTLIYLLLILISEPLEYYIIKYVVLSIVSIICCYIFAILINYLLSIDKTPQKICVPKVDQMSFRIQRVLQYSFFDM